MRGALFGGLRISHGQLSPSLHFRVGYLVIQLHMHVEEHAVEHSIITLTIKLSGVYHGGRCCKVAAQLNMQRGSVILGFK